MNTTIGTNGGGPDVGVFKEAFLRVLLEQLPSWEGYVTQSVQANKPIEVSPPNWDGPPFRIDVHSDTVTIFPFCDFGLDYISTATKEDLEQSPHLVFGKVMSDIADFVNGRTIVAVKRHRWLFMKAGWDVRFVLSRDIDEARRAGASILAWPTG